MPSKKETTVLFIWKVREELQNYLQNHLSKKNITLIFPEENDQQIFLENATDANIIVGWRPTEELLKRAQKLELFINPGVGVQHLLPLFQRVAMEREVVLCNGHGNTYFTAQHAVALLLSLMNKIVPHHNWMQQGYWRKGDANAKTVPLRKREVGLLGYGAINTKVHQFLAGFDINFHVLKKNWKRKRISTLPTKVKKYSFQDLTAFLIAIDILIVAVPLTSLTQGLIAKKEFALLGPNALVVTVARGEVIDEKGFYEALKNKTIAGAAIDVWYNYHPEPNAKGRKFPSKYPFYKLDNVVLSPHRGASPMDDLERWNEVIENIKRYTSGDRNFLNVVNLKDEY